MSTFTYTALNEINSLSRGTIEARSVGAATAALEKEGLMVVNVRQEKRKGFFNRDLNTGLGLAERILITRHLHTMLEAGVALDQALKTIAEQTPQEKIKIILVDLNTRIQKGQPFHTALSAYPKYFTPFYINLIKVGESTGKLDEVLEYLLEQQEKDLSLRTRVFNAMLYPSIILTALVIMVSTMLVFVIPKVTSILTAYHVKLPLTTRILMGMSYGLSHYWYIIFPVLILLVWLVRKGKATPRGSRWWNKFILSLPAMNELVKEVNLARINRSLASMLKSGMSIDQALALGSTVTTNTEYQSAMKRATNFVQRGVNMSEIFRGQSKLFPPLTTRMMEVGEKTGKLDHMLDRLASYYEVSVDNKLGNLSAIIEPLLILTIGLIVGFVAISVLTPIWSFSQTV